MLMSVCKIEDYLPHVLINCILCVLKGIKIMKFYDTHVTRAHGKRMCFNKVCYQMTGFGYDTL